MTWRPEGVRKFGRQLRPEVGQVVAYARRAWEVMHVIDTDLEPGEAERLAGYVQPYRDQMLPYAITLRRLHGAPYDGENSARDIGLRIPVAAYDPFPLYKDGRVPLCSCHHEPWPCLEADQQAHAARELAKAERALRVLPGCCPTCEEPVTSRQKSITFGGPNVSNPLAEGPTFHLRRKCRHGAVEYEELWVADEPGRARSLLTLRCAGTVIVHADGTGECFGADRSDCPSIYARHRCMSACYVQTHGCPKGCPPGRHGTNLAGRPEDPRAITRSTP